MSALCRNILRHAPARQMRRRGRLAFLAVIAAVLGQAISGCDAVPVIPREVALSGKIPSRQSFAYGRVLVEGWPKAILGSSKARVEFQNLSTGEKINYPLEENGGFSLSLAAGRYAVTSVWSGLQSIEPGRGATPMLFAAPPGALVYLGTLLIRLPSATDAKGEIAVRDELAAATRALSERYPILLKNSTPLKGLMIGVPAKSAEGILVDAVLSRRLAALMLLDSSSPYTILTRETAREFGVRIDNRDSAKNFQTYGGAILSPPMRLKSIRIANFELQDVEVVVDVDGYFPIGILGKSVLRNFKVTVDSQKREARFER